MEGGVDTMTAATWRECDEKGERCGLQPRMEGTEEVSKSTIHVPTLTIPPFLFP